MKSYDEYAATARPGRPFSNSTEWETFNWNVCQARGKQARACVNDPDPEVDGGCPLVLLSMVDMTPAEWTGKPGRYRCSAHTTAAQARAAEDEALAQKIADSHYPMFDVSGVVDSRSVTPDVTRDSPGAFTEGIPN
ncbi:hypothetical protein ACWDNI_35740 [Nocardia niigatensis]